MNIYVRACVQSVHNQHAHILDGHATGLSQCRWYPGQSQTKLASSVFTRRRCHEYLFHTRIDVQHPK